LGLYPHWGTRVGISAFDYAGNPEGVISSIILKDVLMIKKKPEYSGLILYQKILFYLSKLQ